MHWSRPFRGVLVSLTVLSTIAVLTSSVTVHAASPLVVGGEIGAGHYTLDDWSDFFGGLTRGHYSEERISPNWTLFVGYDLADNHTIKLTIGHHCVEPQLASVLGGSEDPPSTYLVNVIAWKLSATPVGVAYEFTPPLTPSVDLVTGFEAAYYWSKVKAREHYIFDPSSIATNFDSQGARKEQGYGLTLYLGLRAPVTDRVALCPKVRARYAPGSEFTDEEKAIAIEFTGFDVALGLDVRPF